MKLQFLLISVLFLVCISCKDNEQVFDKSADERAKEAIANLKEKLTAPPDGWLLKYRPEKASGSFNVLLKFDENNNVNIKTDLGVNEGEFYDQTISYRIDNSLGLELIFETYSFFSYLFEQESATFGAEYEFNYVNETPDGALVFNSKTDPSSPTILTFQPASTGDESLLGIQLASNLNKLSEDLKKFTSVYKLTYTDKDLAFYLSFDDFRRTVNFNYAAPKSGNDNGQALTFSAGYIIQGESMIFDTPFTLNFMGNQVSIPSIDFDVLTEDTISACTSPIPINRYTGTITGSNEKVALETTLFDPNGANFTEASSFFYSSIRNIFDNGISAGEQIAQDVNGAQDMQLYYINDPNNPFLAIGFRIQNSNATTTWALRDFTPTVVGNKIQFDLAPNYTLYGDTTATVDEGKMNIYLDKLTEGGSTHIFKYSDSIYEFYNPCNGWSFVFFAN